MYLNKYFILFFLWNINISVTYAQNQMCYFINFHEQLVKSDKGYSICDFFLNYDEIHEYTEGVDNYLNGLNRDFNHIIRIRIQTEVYIIIDDDFGKTIESIKFIKQFLKSHFCCYYPFNHKDKRNNLLKVLHEKNELTLTQIEDLIGYFNLMNFNILYENRDYKLNHVLITIDFNYYYDFHIYDRKINFIIKEFTFIIDDNFGKTEKSISQIMYFLKTIDPKFDRQENNEININEVIETMKSKGFIIKWESQETHERIRVERDLNRIENEESFARIKMEGEEKKDRVENQKTFDRIRTQKMFARIENEESFARIKMEGEEKKDRVESKENFTRIRTQKMFARIENEENLARIEINSKENLSRAEINNKEILEKYNKFFKKYKKIIVIILIIILLFILASIKLSFTNSSE